MKMYNAAVEVDTKNAGDVDDLMTQLEHHHPAVGISPRGWLEARISLPAENLLQASTTAIMIVEAATGAAAIAAEVMTEEEFAAREGFTVEPDIVTTEDAAKILGVSRERVLQHIRAGRLQVIPTSGRGKVLTRSSVEALRANPNPAGRPRKTDA